MSQLTDKKRSKARDEVIEPAVKYVRAERKRNGEDEKDAKVESSTLKNSGNNFAEFYNMNTFTKEVASKIWSEKMAKRMIEWAVSNEDALTLNEFYVSIGMLSQDFCALADKFPILDKALNFVKQIIGNRREKGMLTRKFDAGSTAYMMPHYSPEWKENVAWRATLRQPAGSSGNPQLQFVVVPDIKSLERSNEDTKVQIAVSDIGKDAQDGSRG